MTHADDVRDGRLVLLGLGCLAFVALAVVAELLGSLWANSVVPAWAELAPIAWPPAARVVWWSMVALAALTYRLSLARVGLAQRRAVTVASVVPFVAFAAGSVELRRRSVRLRSSVVSTTAEHPQHRRTWATTAAVSCGVASPSSQRSTSRR